MSDAFSSLKNDFKDVLKLNKVLRKTNKNLDIIENESSFSKLKELKDTFKDHPTFFLEHQKLDKEIAKIRNDFSYAVGKFTSGKEKFDLSILKYALGFDPFQINSSLLSNFTISKSKCLLKFA